jgi:sulfate adenylyltransferase subunit 2
MHGTITTAELIKERVADSKRAPVRLAHLAQLEAESIHIIREAVAESDNPVMLYSIGKDSSVLVHLALKAFYPAKPPFPLLHVDTTWKFHEMIAFAARTSLGSTSSFTPTRKASSAAFRRSRMARSCTPT